MLEDLLQARYSCRAFLPTPVPRETIERIVNLAQRSASWCNSQAWQLVITRGEGTERFRRALLEQVDRQPPAPDLPWPREYLGVYRDRRRECGFQLYESVGVGREDKAGAMRQARRNFELFDAPHVAIVTSPEPLGTYGAVDCGAFVGSFMLAARSLGVASIAQAALASQSAFVRGHFGIGNDRLMVCGISFGFEDPDHPANRFRTRRAGLDEAVTWVDR